MDIDGSYENPLRLAQDTLLRPLAEKHLKGSYKDFKNMKADGWDYLQINIAGNPHLSKGANRVILALLWIFEQDWASYNNSVRKSERQTFQEYLVEGLMFEVATPESKHTTRYFSRYGFDSETFHTINNGAKVQYDINFPNLIETLEKNGVTIALPNLLSALKELHQFHYITISPEPSKHDKITTTQVKKQTRRPWKHIRFYSGMIEKPFFSKVIDKPTRKRSKKKDKVTVPIDDNRA
jgi:hypothetical protein